MFALAIRQLAGEHDAAEDVVQEAWMRAAERWTEFRGQSARRTWLCGFVVRVAWELQRRAAASPAPQTDGAALTDGAAFGDERLRGVFERVDLERAIAALPPGFRAVLLLHDVEGYTHDEIAATLGIVAGTSKSQLARARQALRRALTSGGPDAPR